MCVCVYVCVYVYVYNWNHVVNKLHFNKEWGNKTDISLERILWLLYWLKISLLPPNQHCNLWQSHGTNYRQGGQTHLGRKMMGNQTHKINQIYRRHNRNTCPDTLGNLWGLAGIRALVSSLPDQPRQDKRVLCFEVEKEAGVSTEISESQGSRSLTFLTQIEEGGTGWITAPRGTRHFWWVYAEKAEW